MTAPIISPTAKTAAAAAAAEAASVRSKSTRSKESQNDDDIVVSADKRPTYLEREDVEKSTSKIRISFFLSFFLSSPAWPGVSL